MNAKSLVKPKFGVDRRPVAVFTPSAGGCSSTGMKSIGWSSRYYTQNGLNDFVNEFLFAGSRNGINRFVCMYPAGSAGSLGSANVYKPFKEEVLNIYSESGSCKRGNPLHIWGDPVEAWRNSLAEWREEFGNACSFAVGMSLLSPFNGFSDNSSLGYAGNVLGVSQNNSQFLSWLSYNLGGWKNIGADSVAFSSINFVNYYGPRLGYSIQEFVLNNLEMNCIGIGLPHDKTDVGRLADATYSLSPFLLRSFDASNGYSALGGAWDPDNTEIHVTLKSSEITEEDVNSYFNKGVITGIEFDPDNPRDFYQAAEMVSSVYNELENKRLSTSKRNMTVFSMVAGDQRDFSGALDSRFGSFNSSKASDSDSIIPVIRINCSSKFYPSDPDRLFIPSWWWTNNKLSCPDPYMKDKLINSWIGADFSRNIILSNSKSPYGTTGPEKCADAFFDLMIQYITRYSKYESKPMSQAFDIVLSLENWGSSGSFCSDDASGGIVDGECRLFGHPGDMLSSTASYAPLFDMASPFSYNGKLECSQWMDRFFIRLKYRRLGYAVMGAGNVPPLPSKIIINGIRVPSAQHLMLDAVSKEGASEIIGKDIKRNIENFYGNLSAIVSDQRFYDFNINGVSLSSMYNDSLQSGFYDIDAVSPENSGSNGSYGLKDARSDKDYLRYQPNVPMKRWFNNAIKNLTSLYVEEIFKSVVERHVPGVYWGLNDISILNNSNYSIYDISSPVSSDIVVAAGSNFAQGNLSLPAEKRMHISRLAMPGLHNQQIPENTIINCFDIAGSSQIKDGSYLPYWGAGYTRPIVGVSTRISQNSNLTDINVVDDRSKWSDIPGSIFSYKDASTSFAIKGSKSTNVSLASNDVVRLSQVMSDANKEANLNIIKNAIVDALNTEIKVIPIIRGTAIADSSWKNVDIGNIKTGQPSSDKNSFKYKVDKKHLVDMVKMLSDNGCTSFIHSPYSHTVSDWNNLYDSIADINKSETNSPVTVASSSTSSSSDITKASSFAISISYDFTYISNVSQIKSRPSISIDENMLNNDLLSISITSPDGANILSLPMIPIREMRVLDVVNIVGRQPGMVAKVLNGNGNIPASGLQVVRDPSGNSGWIFLVVPDSKRTDNTPSEARSRPLDYLRVKNTTIDVDIYQNNPSMSVGGFVSDMDSFESYIISSPIYLNSEIIKTENAIPAGEFVVSINGEIMSILSSGINESNISSRAMFGSRRKMHIPGDMAILGHTAIFDSRFGNSQGEFEQYRCFALKNISNKNTVHSIQFVGNSNSTSSKIEMAFEFPLLNYQKIKVKSSAIKFIEPDNVVISEEMAKTLLGTQVGMITPSGVIIKRSISFIEGNILYFNSSLPYTPLTGSDVLLYGSKSGYSAGGLFYPTEVGNSRTDFYSMVSGDTLNLNSIDNYSEIMLKPGEYIYVWFRRRIYKGVRSIDAGNFMPNIRFEVA